MAKNICLTIPVLLAIFHNCVGIGIRRTVYESKYGRVIHEETAGCGSLHEVGPEDKFFFNSKLIRSPFDSSNKRDIHYLDVSKSKIKSDSVASNNEEESSGLNSATETPHSDEKGKMGEPGPGEPPSDEESGPIPKPDHSAAPSNSRKNNLVSNKMESSQSNYKKSVSNAYQKDYSKISQRKINRDQKWRAETPSFGAGQRYNSLGKEVLEEVTTSAPVVISSRKPHWSDKYLGKTIKESSIFDEGQDRSLSKLQPRISSALSRKERRGFFSSQAHEPFGDIKKISKRSIFSNQKRTDLQKGKHETCTWRFTSKPSCKYLVARLTRFKENEVHCDKEYLLFKGHFNQMRFCDQKMLFGSFHAKGKTLIVEHKKVLGGAESNFEGYVTCLDQ